MPAESSLPASRGRPALPVYLDYQSNAPLDERVHAAMLDVMRERCGNPHSVHHRYGWQADRAVEAARREVAGLVGADPDEIVFTSGATEANNLALRGVAAECPPSRRHIVTCTTEHKCVLEPARLIEAEGFRVTRLPVGSNGLVDLGALEAALAAETALVSIMAVNNEIGVVQPLAEIGALCAARDILFHTDAAQAAGNIPLDVRAMHIDLLSLSGHKVYGPMGIGALFVRRHPRVRLAPLIVGGGQERGLRAGTLPTPLCVGFGRACALAKEQLESDSSRIMRLRNGLLASLRRAIPDLRVNGDLNQRAPGNLSITIPHLDAEDLIFELEDLALSTGSACGSDSGLPSHVLKAIGLSDEMAHASLRIGIGRYTTDGEIQYAAAQIITHVRALRHPAGSGIKA